jgi:hypothetical protein
VSAVLLRSGEENCSTDFSYPQRGLLLRTLNKMRPRSGRFNSVAVSSKLRYTAFSMEAPLPQLQRSQRVRKFDSDVGPPAENGTIWSR